LVIEPQFREVRDFSEGAAAVRQGKYWHYINREGRVVLAGRFNDAKDFAGSLALVHEGGVSVARPHGPPSWEGGAWFYINRRGEKVHRYRTDTAP
jgi:hypothetical protein